MGFHCSYDDLWSPRARRVLSPARNPTWGLHSPTTADAKDKRLDGAFDYPLVTGSVESIWLNTDNLFVFLGPVQEAFRRKGPRDVRERTFLSLHIFLLTMIKHLLRTVEEPVTIEYCLQEVRLSLPPT